MRALIFSYLFIFLAGVCGLCHAADSSECMTPQQMTARMKAEGQRAIAQADVVSDNKFLGMVFTSNEDLSVGYILKATDKPIGQVPSQFCIYNRMVSLRLFDARKQGIPTEALLRASDEDAMRKCSELMKTGKFTQGSCGPFNSVIRRTEHLGDRVMFQGFNTSKVSDGSYREDGTLFTISANITGRVDGAPLPHGLLSGILLSTLPDGATFIHAVLKGANYTEQGLVLLGKQRLR